jgi:hypothetical protein
MAPPYTSWHPMRPIHIALGIEIEATAEHLWSLLTDWERQGDWMVEASDFVVTSEHREGVGVEAKATIRVAGIRTRDRIRTDVWQPPYHLGILHLGWVKGRGDLRLLPLSPTRTLVDWREVLQPPWGVLGGVGLWTFKPVLARIFRRDLRLLKRLAEGGSRGSVP